MGDIEEVLFALINRLKNRNSKILFKDTGEVLEVYKL